MPTLILARLYQDQTYLRRVSDKTQVLTEKERVSLRAFFTVLVDNLHQLYPHQVPEGRRYHFLHYLAQLDEEVQRFSTTPNYLHVVANRHQLAQVAVTALDYALALDTPAA
jgi:hypothetical protein